MFGCICLFKLSLFSTDRPRSKIVGSCGTCIFYFRGAFILFSIMPISNLYSRGVPFLQALSYTYSLQSFWWWLLQSVWSEICTNDIYFGNRILPPSLRLPPVLSQTKMPPNISSMLTSIIIMFFFFLIFSFRKWNDRVCVFGGHIYFIQHLLLTFQPVVTVVC